MAGIKQREAEDTLVLPAWFRYANEPGALVAVILLHTENMARDPANAGWYRDEIADIETYLRRFHADEVGR